MEIFLIEVGERYLRLLTRNPFAYHTIDLAELWKHYVEIILELCFGIDKKYFQRTCSHLLNLPYLGLSK